MGNRWRLGSVLVGTAVGLMGCASMSPRECQTADWYQRGLQDGLDGETSQRLGEHQEACSKAGVVPDGVRWQAGRQEGLKSYCTPNGAWVAGLANAGYRGVCADRDEPTFLRYHRAGTEVYRARQDLSQTRSRINQLEAELKKATKDEDRKRLRDDIGRAERERSRLTAVVLALELSGAPR